MRRILFNLSVLMTIVCITSCNNKQVDSSEVKENEDSIKIEELFDHAYDYQINGDYSKAISLYKKAADKGNIAALINIGNCYDEIGEYSQAISWYKKAIDNKSLDTNQLTDAMLNLASCYECAEGTTRNYNMAFYWFKKAAEKGDEDAITKLGSFYYQGKGVTKDYTQAVFWYKKAAEKGHAGAMNNLGMCYEYGDGVPKDYSLSLYWFKKAVEGGVFNSLYRISLHYKYGYGVEKDSEKAEILEYASNEAKAGNNKRAMELFYKAFPYLVTNDK